MNGTGEDDDGEMSTRATERSASAVKFVAEVIALVSKRPIWLVEAACAVTARSLQSGGSLVRSSTARHRAIRVGTRAISRR
jgi:hypothetical protein